ncbi:hypothetical protein AAMO2058_000494700 [Amorphochlora amoebiformis]
MYAAPPMPRRASRKSLMIHAVLFGALIIAMFVWSTPGPSALSGGIRRMPSQNLQRLMSLRGGVDLEALKKRGNTLFQQGKFDQAKEAYTQALGSATDRTDEMSLAILRNRAAANMKLGLYKEAINDCTEVLKADKECSKAKLRRAMAIDKMNDPSFYAMGYRDCRELVHEGEGAVGVDTFREVKRIEKRLRETHLKSLKDEDLCKQCYDDAMHCIEYQNMNLIDWAIEDLTVALDWIEQHKENEFKNGSWAAKCLERRVEYYKQTSNYDALIPDLNYLLELTPNDLKLRLLRCQAYEACERWQKCLKEARNIVNSVYGPPDWRQNMDAEGFIKRMTFFVEKIAGKKVDK